MDHRCETVNILRKTPDYSVEIIFIDILRKVQNIALAFEQCRENSNTKISMFVHVKHCNLKLH